MSGRKTLASLWECGGWPASSFYFLWRSYSRNKSTDGEADILCLYSGHILFAWKDEAENRRTEGSSLAKDRYPNLLTSTRTYFFRRAVAAAVDWLTRGPKGSLWPVLAFYTAVSTGYWGLPIVGHWTTRMVGSGTDPLNIFVWSMAWWPYALTHGINPLILNKVFVPVVTDAGWRTVVPLLSVAASPLTLTAGPVASYNLAMLMAPSVTATMTYLLMSEFVSKRWVALWAGYMVGFSTYEVYQTLGHLHLTFAALVPLALWLGVRIYRSLPLMGGARGGGHRRDI